VSAYGFHSVGLFYQNRTCFSCSLQQAPEYEYLGFIACDVDPVQPRLQHIKGGIIGVDLDRFFFLQG
jgi:hypothetical protein